MGKQNLVLLPGWAMDDGVWEPIRDGLTEYFDLYPCSWSGIKSAKDFAGRVSRLIDEKIDGDFSLMGWSLGSLLAIDAAGRYRERVKQVILVSGTSRFTRDRNSGYTSGWPKNVVERMKTALQQDKQKTLTSFCTSMFSDDETHQGHHEKFTETAIVDANPYDVDELLAGLDFLIETDLRQQLQAIKAPVLLIHGRQDTICPVTASETITKGLKGQVSLQILENTGHVPFFTAKDEFMSRLKAFVEVGERLVEKGEFNDR